MRRNPAESHVFVIPLSNRARFQDRMAALARRAKKLGLEPAKFTFGRNVVKTVTVEVGKGPRGEPLVDNIDVPAVEVTVEMTEPPHMQGWKLVAIRELVDDEAVIQCLPGSKTEPWMHERAPGACQHCNTTRNRKDTFLLVHEDGRHIQIGRQCLQDFLPGTSAAEIAAHAEYYASMASDLDELGEGWDEMAGGGASIDIVDVGPILNVTAMLVREFGFLSRVKAEETGVESTSDTVKMYLFSTSPSDAKFRHAHPITEKDKETAKKTLEWAATITPEDCQSNDFLEKLSTLLRLGHGRMKHIGIIAAAIPSYLRTQRFKEMDKDLLPPAEREYVGEVGKREFFTVKLKSEPFAKLGDFGTTYIHNFIVEGGHSAVWFGSSNIMQDPWPPAAVPGGDWFSVKATVKTQDVYHPTFKDAVPFKQTVFSRLSKEDDVPKVKVKRPKPPPLDPSLKIFAKKCPALVTVPGYGAADTHPECGKKLLYRTRESHWGDRPFFVSGNHGFVVSEIPVGEHPFYAICHGADAHRFDVADDGALTPAVGGKPHIQPNECERCYNGGWVRIAVEGDSRCENCIRDDQRVKSREQEDERVKNLVMLPGGYSPECPECMRYDHYGDNSKRNPGELHYFHVDGSMWVSRHAPESPPVVVIDVPGTEGAKPTQAFCAKCRTIFKVESPARMYSERFRYAEDAWVDIKQQLDAMFPPPRANPRRRNPAGEYVAYALLPAGAKSSISALQDALAWSLSVDELVEASERDAAGLPGESQTVLGVTFVDDEVENVAFVGTVDA